jgi:UDP-N-acetylglucosamine--N-acetylmuramyl-(pentapeptide) pyrophosphoryl-undecaprenol N-acetylglucosamine transferase
MTFLFVGGESGMERDLVLREGVEFVGIQAGGIHGLGVMQKMRNALKLFSGFMSALGIVNKFKPNVVLLTGGFVGVPVSIAAWLKRVPSVVFLPDVEPGLALKAMAALATKVATTTSASAPFVPVAKHIVTGYPVRNIFYKVSRDHARQHFGIEAQANVVLVFGGSKGARSINRAVIADIATLLEKAVVIHVTGNGDWAEVSTAREGMTDAQKVRYLAYPYLHEDMAAAMACADLVICRSGASALGELPLLGVPAILVPYPHAWRYQKVNAQYLVEHGAAVMLEDAKLNDLQEGLLASISRLLSNTHALTVMREAMLKLATPNGAGRIAAVLQSVATPTQSRANIQGGRVI